MRIYLRRCVKFAGIWLISCMVIGVVVTEWALHPWQRVLTPEAEAQAQTIAARNHAVLTEVAVTASDGAILRGWSIRPLHGNGDAVILLHGVADNRMGMIGYADLLLRHGYAVLLPDARRHGASGGELATYGIKEAGDIRRWYDWIEQTEAPRCIDGLGNSMGAALLSNLSRMRPAFARWLSSRPLQTSVKPLMTGWRKGYMPARGWGVRCCVRRSRLDFSMHDGSMGWIWSRPRRRMR
jgi:pimeloyl-ACP methyl ester carboxylesterase